MEALKLSEVEVLSAMNIFGQLLKKIKEEEVKLEGNNTSVMNGERIRSSRERARGWRSQEGGSSEKEKDGYER